MRNRQYRKPGGTDGTWNTGAPSPAQNGTETAEVKHAPASRFRLTPLKPKIVERDVTAMAERFFKARGWRVLRLQSGLFKTPDGRFVRIGEPGMTDKMGLRAAPRWCTCEAAGKCTGCQIARAVREHVGSHAAEHLARFTGPATTQLVFVEMKRPGEKLRPEQKEWANRMRMQGFEVLSVDSVKSLANWYGTTFEQEAAER